jgi:hypothetical protein
MTKERKIIVAINYNEFNKREEDEMKNIICRYTSFQDIQYHYVDETKIYIDLRHIDNKKWEDFKSDWCSEDKRLASGSFFMKYDDWRLCALPVGWDD